MNIGLRYLKPGNRVWREGQWATVLHSDKPTVDRFAHLWPGPMDILRAEEPFDSRQMVLVRLPGHRDQVWPADFICNIDTVPAQPGDTVYFKPSPVIQAHYHLPAQAMMATVIANASPDCAGHHMTVKAYGATVLYSGPLCCAYDITHIKRAPGSVRAEGFRWL